MTLSRQGNSNRRTRKTRQRQNNKNFKKQIHQGPSDKIKVSFNSLLQATANTRARLGRFRDAVSMEIDKIGFLEGDLGMTSVVMNLHRLDIRASGLAVRTLEFGVTALFRTRSVS